MILGVTGGIGSGKSLVCEIFAHLGVPIYNSDNRAKELMSSSPDLISAISELFGEQAYLDGQLNRMHIASVVFNDKQKLESLNKIVHPAVGADFDTWIKENKTAPIVVKEAAIMVESGAYKSLDKLLVVSAPESVRIQRVMDRDSIARDEVIKRIRQQLKEDELLEYADYVVHNDGEHLLVPQVVNIYNHILDHD